MFQIGFWELVVIIIVAVWVLGPQHLAVVAKLGARWISQGKQLLSTIRSELNDRQPKPVDDQSSSHTE